MTLPEDQGRAGGNPRRSPLLTPDEVVALLENRISTKTLANWRSAGVGGPRFKKLGNRVYYPQDAVEEWMASNDFSSTRDYAEKRDAQKLEQAALAKPAANAADALIAEFDAQIAEVRKLLVARLAELALTPSHTKRPRGRPRKNNG